MVGVMPLKLTDQLLSQAEYLRVRSLSSVQELCATV
jgi:hypothetical protein